VAVIQWSKGIQEKEVLHPGSVSTSKRTAKNPKPSSLFLVSLFAGARSRATPCAVIDSIPLLTLVDNDQHLRVLSLYIKGERVEAKRR